MENTQTATRTYAIQSISKNGVIWNSDELESEYRPHQMFASVQSFQSDNIIWRLFDGEGVLLFEAAKSAKGWILTGGIEFGMRRDQNRCDPL